MRQLKVGQITRVSMPRYRDDVVDRRAHRVRCFQCLVDGPAADPADRLRRQDDLPVCLVLHPVGAIFIWPVLPAAGAMVHVFSST